MAAEKLDLETRCFQCASFAYCDNFEGEYGASGYICLGCIRKMNAALMDEVKRRYFEERDFRMRKQ